MFLKQSNVGVQRRRSSQWIVSRRSIQLTLIFTCDVENDIALLKECENLHDSRL